MKIHFHIFIFLFISSTAFADVGIASLIQETKIDIIIIITLIMFFFMCKFSEFTFLKIIIFLIYNIIVLWFFYKIGDLPLWL